jgi:hypothetical protein
LLLRFTSFYYLILVLLHIKQINIILLLLIFIVTKISLKIDVARVILLNNFNISINVVSGQFLYIKFFCEWIIKIVCDIYRHVMIWYLFWILIFVWTNLIFTCNRANFLAFNFDIIFMIEIHFIDFCCSLFPMIFAIIYWYLITVYLFFITCYLLSSLLLKILWTQTVWIVLIVIIQTKRISAIAYNKFVVSHLKLILNGVWNFWIIVCIEIENIGCSYFLPF